VIIDTSSDPAGPGQGPQGPWAGSAGGRPGSHGRVIGEVDQFSAPVLVHDDAIYLHEGRQYHVERLDWEEKRAYVHPIEVDHYTLAETRQTVRVLERFAGPVGEAVRRSHGEVRVSRLATVYKKVRFLTHENVGWGPIHLPEQDLQTTAVWAAFPPPALAGLSPAEQEVGLVGASRALHAAACLLCMCDPRDLGVHVELRTQPGPDAGHPLPPALGPPAPGEPQEFVAGWRPAAPIAPPVEEGAGWPAVYLYDATPGGVGFAPACFDRFAEMVRAAIDLAAGCACAAGCPSCVGPPPSGFDGRAAALRLLHLAGEPG